MFGGVQQDLAGGVQTVFAAAQGEFGFVQVFVGQHIDRFGIDIRRVGNNQVVCAFQSFEQIGVNQVDTVFQSIIFDVDGGYFQRIQTQIDGVNFSGGGSGVPFEWRGSRCRYTNPMRGEPIRGVLSMG